MLCRKRKKNPEIHMEPQKTKNSKSNPKKEKQSWGYHILISRYVTKLQ